MPLVTFSMNKADVCDEDDGTMNDHVMQQMEKVSHLRRKAASVLVRLASVFAEQFAVSGDSGGEKESFFILNLHVCLSIESSCIFSLFMRRFREKLSSFSCYLHLGLAKNHP